MLKPKQSLFSDLSRRVQDCNLCPRMTGRKRVLSHRNGSLDSSVVFIAEAPGRLGADLFGIPLYGDQTGKNFEAFLVRANLERASVFVTNSVLCNPRTPNGNNDSPRLREIQNCSQFLGDTLNIIGPKLIVPLGVKALAALSVIEPIKLRLSESVGKLLSWHGHWLYPLYHPGPRALIYRNKAQQIQDYLILASYLDKLTPMA